MENMIQFSEEIYKIIAENTTDLIAITTFSNDPIYVYVNPAHKRILGYEKDEMIGKNAFDFIYPRDRALLIKRLNRYIGKMNHYHFHSSKDLISEQFIFRLVDKRGSVHYLDQTANIYENYLLFIAKDITEKKITRKQLVNETWKNATLLDAAADGIRIINTDFKVLSMNKTFAEMSGIPIDEGIGMNCQEILGTTEYCGTSECSLVKTLNCGKRIQRESVRIRKDGRKIPTLEVITPHYDSTGKFIGVIEDVRDITDIKKVNELLQESLDNTENILESLPIGIIVVNKDKQIRRVNSKALSIIGKSRDEILHKKCYSTFCPETKDHCPWNSGQKIESLEKMIIGSHDKKIPVIKTVVPIKFHEEDVLVEAFVDLREQKRMEENYKKLFTNSQNGIAICKLVRDDVGWPLDCLHINVNPAIEKQFGCHQGEFLGKSAKELLGNEAGFRYAQMNGKCVIDRQSHSWVDFIPLFNKYVRMESYPIKDDFFAITFVDVSREKIAQKQLIESEKKYRTYVQSAPFGVFVTDEKGSYIEVNTAASLITGYSKDELIAMNLSDITPDQYKKEGLAHFQRLLTNGCSTGDLPFIHKDGSIRFWVVDAIKLSDTRFLGFVRDVTDKKEADEELRDAHEKIKMVNQNLESIIAERTEKIQQLLKQKDEFINQLGHDLKNPLSPFISLLPILEKHVNGDKDKEIINVLNRNARYMRNLVDKTIELAKLNSSKIEFTFEQLILSDLLDEVIDVNIILFEENDMIVENNVSPNLSVNVNKLRIQEVFTNLFNNALKYTEGQGKIIIHARRNDENIVVSVKDTGIGLSKEQIDHLFDEYYKVDTSRHDFDSTGLGLSICKRIIERHGGRIWAESEGLGKGSEFYFTLPITHKKMESE